MREAKECDRYKGRSKAECERYGKPCIGAHYMGNDDVHKYRRDAARCIICGQPATDVHHWPPIGKSHAGLWTLETPKGWHVLKPALFALCRTCHDRWHSGQISADWIWETPEIDEAYWAGEITRHVQFMPQAAGLYKLGHWRFTFKGGGGFDYRETEEDGQWKAIRTAIRKEPEEP